MRAQVIIMSSKINFHVVCCVFVRLLECSPSGSSPIRESSCRLSPPLSLRIWGGVIICFVFGFLFVVLDVHFNKEAVLVSIPKWRSIGHISETLGFVAGEYCTRPPTF